MIYDIFYISKKTINDLDWKKFKNRFPFSQKIENVENFENVRLKAFTKFFYVVWDGTEILDFSFDYRVSEWDENYIHVWKTLRNDEETYQGGVALFPKNVNLVSSREFANKFYLNKKEIQKIASKQIYPIYTFKNYEEYKTILENTAHDMFWYIPNDVEIINSDIFNLYFDANNGKYDYDRNENHVFRNQNIYDGVVLFSKNKLVSEKEFKNRFFISKKEHDIVVSQPLPFEVHNINTYEAYLNVLNECKTNMFWVVWSDTELTKELTYHVPYYDQHIIHVFKNNEFYDGVVLFPKNEKVSKKEFDFRFYKNRKEIDMQMSVPKPYDIFFISYNESNADENYKLLCNRFPKAKRIHGVEGIHNAHKAAAENSETEMFWVVDADAILLEDFNFEIEYYAHYDSGNRKEHLSTVHIWKSQNPINGLIYGYGGVKLLPKNLVLRMNTETVDMTTSISEKIKIMQEVSNITAFNVSPFETWKSAFRECVKLSSKIIDRNYDEENEVRLKIWMEKGEDRLFGKYALAGAKAGYMYGSMNLGNNDSLRLINDFQWLKSQFIEWQKENEK